MTLLVMAKELTYWEIEALAEDIMNDKVMTSRDVWSYADGSSEKYLVLMKQIFKHSGFYDKIDLLKEVLKDTDSSKMLFYAYYTDMNPREKGQVPVFEKSHIIHGDNLKILDDLLMNKIKMQVLH